MIPRYIEDWLTIIEQMSNDNTYKLAWGRAVIECISNDTYFKRNTKVEISFDDISLNMLKYYWNQIFFFNLKQSPYKDKNPIICNDTEKLINLYKKENKTSIPIWFNNGLKFFKENYKIEFDRTIKNISKTLHSNVCWRFKNVLNGTIEIYEYDKKNGSKIIFEEQNIELLKEYSIIISKLLNFKWTQLLEKFNYSPKIASKVCGISEAKLRRSSLKKFREELLKEHDGRAIDFYTNKELDANDISIDHVIPWSFMYSDDIWNLVITSKENNSKKNNQIPSNKIISKLKERNTNLVYVLTGSMHDELEIAIKNNYVDKFYYDCRL